MDGWLLLMVVVLFASILQTSTGFGFSIIGTPFLFLLFPIHTAVQVNIVLSICLSGFMIYKIRKEIDRQLLITLIKGSIFGLIIGLIIYLYMDIHLLKMTVGMLIIILTVLLILQLSIKQSTKRDLLTGGISGLLTTSIGVPGPPLLLYFSSVGTNKSTLRSTTLAYYLFVYFVSLIMQIVFGGTSSDVWIASIIGLPALIIGIFAGQLLFKWISQKTFKIITYIILIFTGVYLIISS